MSPHPPSCIQCRGTGWTEGPPIYETVQGRPHPYTTVVRCQHRWWDDEPLLDLDDANT